MLIGKRKCARVPSPRTLLSVSSPPKLSAKEVCIARLRPFGSEGVLVSNLEALEDYYQNNGREWERYAWIKGRAINYENSTSLGSNIHALLRPFIFRKYLDFNALNSMRDLKLQIHRDVMQKGQQDNIKLGRGGIREIEFIAQVFQLIRGGQDASLQIKPTLEVLNLLKTKGLLQEKTVEELSVAYVFLRNLEHRLMYVDDAQTQELPKSDETKARIARAMHDEMGQDLMALRLDLVAGSPKRLPALLAHLQRFPFFYCCKTYPGQSI